MTRSSIVVMCSLLPSGKIADKIERRKPLLMSWLVYIHCHAAFIYWDLPRLLVYCLIAGISGALYMPPVSALQADLVPMEKRGKSPAASGSLTSSCQVELSLWEAFCTNMFHRSFLCSSH